MRAGPVSLLLFNPNSPSVTMATATSHRLSGAAGWPLEDPITLTNGSGARGGNTGCTQGFLSLLGIAAGAETLFSGSGEQGTKQRKSRSVAGTGEQALAPALGLVPWCSFEPCTQRGAWRGVSMKGLISVPRE